LGTSNVRQASVTQNIGHLFSDGTPLTLARYPKQGYRAISDSLSETVFSDTRIDAAISFAPGNPSKGVVKYLWNASGRPCGAYCIRVKAGNKTLLKKIFLMR
jgi:hypothetical protein